jgi:hypothetical protein
VPVALGLEYHDMVVACEDVVDLAAQRAADESAIPANSSCFPFRRPEFIPWLGALDTTSSASSVSIVVVSFVSNAANSLTEVGEPGGRSALVHWCSWQAKSAEGLRPRSTAETRSDGSTAVAVILR